MTTLYEKPLIDLSDLEIRAEQAEVVTWQGREALRLENGLALVPGHRIADGSIEVLIGADGPAYPGIAFRAADVLNFELAYAVPHVSGQWDALQYDPVFHGSNTWQVYHGPSYQRAAQSCPTTDGGFPIAPLRVLLLQVPLAFPHVIQCFSMHAANYTPLLVGCQTVNSPGFRRYGSRKPIHQS